MQTPEQIAAEQMDRHIDPEGTGSYGPDLETTAEAVQALVIAAIEADRAQRAEAIATLGVAADHWARELRLYIAPASAEAGDYGSMESQMAEADNISNAIRELGI